jgi:hypothetical protein
LAKEDHAVLAARHPAQSFVVSGHGTPRIVKRSRE